MSEKDWQAAMVGATVDEPILVSPASVAQVSERSFGLPARDPLDWKDPHQTVTIERPSKVSQVLADTSEQTIVRWNITRFRNLLLIEANPARRTLMSRLLAEEQAKLLKSQGPQPTSKARK